MIILFYYKIKITKSLIEKNKICNKIKTKSKELQEIDFAFKICKFVKSNAIVITKDKATIGIGAGQQNRLDSCKIASQKAKTISTR